MRETAARRWPACLCWGRTRWQVRFLQSHTSEDAVGGTLDTHHISSPTGQVGCCTLVPAGEAACDANSAASLGRQALHGGVACAHWEVQRYLVVHEPPG